MQKEVVKSIGMLLLEGLKVKSQSAGGLMLSEAMIGEQYPQALQEFTDYVKGLGHAFEEADIPGLRMLVVDDVTCYLERKGALA